MNFVNNYVKSHIMGANVLMENASNFRTKGRLWANFECYFFCFMFFFNKFNNSFCFHTCIELGKHQELRGNHHL